MDVDYDLAMMVREYRYRTMFKCSREEYLSTPRERVTMMLEIGAILRNPDGD